MKRTWFWEILDIILLAIWILLLILVLLEVPGFQASEIVPLQYVLIPLGILASAVNIIRARKRRKSEERKPEE